MPVNDISPLAAPGDNGPQTSSIIVAEGTGVEHASVIKLIRNNLADLEEFGLVGFRIRPRPQGQHGGADVEFAVLNEEQATLLLTYMRNSPVVRRFKKNLVRAFYELRSQPGLAQLPDRRTLAQMVIDAEDARAKTETQLALEKKAREAVETYAKDLEPRAENYDRFLCGDGTLAVGVVAKMLGTGQNKLFAELRNTKVFISKGALRNTPYQQYMHHFDVKAFEYTREDGTIGTSYKTRVQPSGVDFIARKVGRTIQTQVDA